jgi:hypothetical protein
LEYAWLSWQVVVVIDSDYPLDNGRRVYAECPTLKDAMRYAAEDFAAARHPEIWVRRGRCGGWRLHEPQKSKSLIPYRR